MLAALILSALAMTLIVGVRYLIVSGVFAWATERRRPLLYDGQGTQIRREIFWSLLSAAIYGVPAGIVAWGWTSMAGRASIPMSRTIRCGGCRFRCCSISSRATPGSTGRIAGMHRPALFRAAHAVHHASRPPTAWAAMSFHPWEALTGAVVIPALVFLIPIHVAALGVVLAVMTVMGVTNHMGWEMFPRYLVHGACRALADHRQPPPAPPC